MDNLTSYYDPSGHVGSFDYYNNAIQNYQASQTDPFIDYESSSNKYNLNYQFQNKYVSQNTSFNSFLQSYSNNYRKLDTMFRFYRISNTLSIDNPDRIYNMFLTRLKNRKRLESSPITLELVVAALFYIDQRNNSSNNYTLRDILSRIPNCKVSLKHFSGIVSKVSKEAGISKLCTIYDNSVISNMLNQLRVFCVRNVGATAEALTPSCTTTVLMNMNEFGDLESMINCPTNDLKLSDGSKINDLKKESEDANAHKIRYRLILRLLSSNYDRIERLSKKILSLLDDFFNFSEDVLDPSNRSLFRCKKTLISCIIFVVLSAMKIPVTSTLICSSMGLSKASFYRNHRKLVSRLSSILEVDEESKGDKNITFFKRILQLDEENKDVVDSHGCKYYKKAHNDGCEVSDNKMDYDCTYAPNSISTNKLTYKKSLRCLDILKGNHDSSSTSNSNEHSKENPVYYDRTSDKYVCIYKADGKKRKKSFSVKLYGKEEAISLAREFSKSVSNNS